VAKFKGKPDTDVKNNMAYGTWLVEPARQDTLRAGRHTDTATGHQATHIAFMQLRRAQVS